MIGPPFSLFPSVPLSICLSHSVSPFLTVFSPTRSILASLVLLSFTLRLCFLSFFLCACLCVCVRCRVMCQLLAALTDRLSPCCQVCPVIGSSVCMLFCLQITCGSGRGQTRFPLLKGTPHSRSQSHTLCTHTYTHTLSHSFVYMFLFLMLSFPHRCTFTHIPPSLPVQLHKGFLPLSLTFLSYSP